MFADLANLLLCAIPTCLRKPTQIVGMQGGDTERCGIFSH